MKAQYINTRPRSATMPARHYYHVSFGESHASTGDYIIDDYVTQIVVLDSVGKPIDSEITERKVRSAINER